MSFPSRLIPLLTRKAPYLGQIATRCFAADGIGPKKTLMGQSFHIARDNASQLKFTYGNWCLGGNPSGGGNNNAETVDTLGNNNLLVKASIGPTALGPWTRIPWGGQASINIAPLTDQGSDWTPYQVSSGDGFFVRTYMECAGGVFTISGNQNVALGDIAEVGVNIGDLTDKTMGGTITNAATGYHVCPGEILGMMTRPSIGVFGDSRAQFVSDTPDTSGDMGEICRSIGPYFGYQNMSKRTRTIANFNASHALQIARAAHVSHIICQMGVNEGAVPSSTTISHLLAMYALMPAGKKVFQSTITPYSSGAWTLSDGSDQTPVNRPALSEVNDWIRSNAAGLTGYFEVADVVESSRNSGKWKAPGYTGDGLHAFQAGMLAIRNSGAISPSAFRR